MGDQIRLLQDQSKSDIERIDNLETELTVERTAKLAAEQEADRRRQDEDKEAREMGAEMARLKELEASVAELKVDLDERLAEFAAAEQALMVDNLTRQQDLLDMLKAEKVNMQWKLGKEVKKVKEEEEAKLKAREAQFREDLALAKAASDDQLDEKIAAERAAMEAELRAIDKEHKALSASLQQDVRELEEQNRANKRNYEHRLIEMKKSELKQLDVSQEAERITRETLDHLHTELDDLMRALRESTNLRQEERNSLEENKILREKDSTNQKKLRDLTFDITRQRTENKDKFNKVEQENKQLQKNLKTATEANDKRSEQLAAQRKQLENSKKELEAKDAEIKKLKADVETLLRNADSSDPRLSDKVAARLSRFANRVLRGMARPAQRSPEEEAKGHVTTDVEDEKLSTTDTTDEQPSRPRMQPTLPKPDRDEIDHTASGGAISLLAIASGPPSVYVPSWDDHEWEIPAALPALVETTRPLPIEVDDGDTQGTANANSALDAHLSTEERSNAASSSLSATEPSHLSLQPPQPLAHEPVPSSPSVLASLYSWVFRGRRSSGSGAREPQQSQQPAASLTEQLEQRAHLPAVSPALQQNELLPDEPPLWAISPASCAVPPPQPRIQLSASKPPRRRRRSREPGRESRGSREIPGTLVIPPSPTALRSLPRSDTVSTPAPPLNFTAVLPGYGSYGMPHVASSRSPRRWLPQRPPSAATPSSPARPALLPSLKDSHQRTAQPTDATTYGSERCQAAGAAPTISGTGAPTRESPVRPITKPAPSVDMARPVSAAAAAATVGKSPSLSSKQSRRVALQSCSKSASPPAAQPSGVAAVVRRRSRRSPEDVPTGCFSPKSMLGQYLSEHTL